MFCALRVRDETEFAGGRRATIAVRNSPRKERQECQSHSTYRRQPSHQNTRPTEKKPAPAYTEIKGIAAVYATKLHIRKTIKNASIMPTRDITKEKIIAKSQPAAKRASRESRKSRRVQRYTAAKVSAPQTQRQPPAERVIPGGFHAHGHDHLP